MVCLWWIGAGKGPRLLEDVSAHLRRVFGVRVVTALDDKARPEGTLDLRRRQHSSAAILRWLAASAPSSASKVLAVTDVDLFMPVLTFVYGEAQLGGRAAVVSTARLRDARSAEDGLALATRLAKECVHELGHTYGLVHCGARGCAMSRSANLFELDRKGSALCAECGLLLAERRRGEGSVACE